MPTFDFITDEDFRSSLESDYEELNSCVEAKAWKAVHVLAGSIIEALLVDYLLAVGYTQNDPLKVDLSTLISACRNANYISDRAANLATVVRTYRNLIHPGRLIRLDEAVDENGAKVAQSLVDMIIEDVVKTRQKSYGYTAEQIVNKVELDSSAITILGHLLRSAPSVEIRRLLLKILPQKYLATDSIPLFDSDGDFIEYQENPLAEHLRICFRMAHDLASDEVKSEVGNSYIRVIKEESENVVFAYESAFFKAKDLCYYQPDDISLAKEHLLSRLEKQVDVHLLSALEGMGNYLNNRVELHRVSTILFNAAIFGESNVRAKSRTCMDDIYDGLPENLAKDFNNIILYRCKARPQSTNTVVSDRIEKLKEWIEKYGLGDPFRDE